MKILFLMTQSLDRPGGGGRFFPFAKALTKSKYQIEIATLHENYQNLETTRFEKEGILVNYVGQMHVLAGSQGKTYFGPLKLIQITAYATLALTWHAIRSDADILQVCKAQPMNIMAAWIAHWLSFGKKKIIVDCDDYEAGNNRFSGGWQQKIVSFFENNSPKFSKITFVGNSFIQNHFVDLGYSPEKLKVLYNGVDRERFEVLDSPTTQQKLASLKSGLQFSNGGRFIVYVGAISLTSHALDLLIDTFSQIAIQRQDVNLLLVGHGEDYDYIQKLVIAKQLSERVQMTGHIEGNLIPLYFNLAEFSIDPRIDSIASESSFSLKLLESIASGVPCISTQIGDRNIVSDKSVAMVPPGDQQALVDMINLLLDNQDLLKSMQLAAHNERKEYYWENKIEPILYLYQ
jgi:glycosyltransferase involved in cell wall biosynthesis